MDWQWIRLEGETTAAPPAGSLGGNLIPLIFLALMLVAMYFIMIRPQRKQKKEEQKMRSSLRVGDEIVTIGGICGRIVNIKEDALIIETGADRSKMTVKNWAVQVNNTIHDAADVDDDDDDDDDDI